MGALRAVSNGGLAVRVVFSVSHCKPSTRKHALQSSLDTTSCPRCTDKTDLVKFLRSVPGSRRMPAGGMRQSRVEVGLSILKPIFTMAFPPGGTTQA
eukprot:3071011-Karenia_brevis.AAC.1